jgi:hypothetical protein
MDCSTSFYDTPADSTPRKMLIAKTVSVLEMLPTCTLIEVLCELSRLCPEARWGPGRSVPVESTVRLHKVDPQADCESSRDDCQR